jgi:predicted HicB family RNase H-like nuclease
MNILKYKDFEGTAEVDVGRGVCRGKLLFIDDLVRYESDSPKRLQAEFEAAVDDSLQTCEQVGKNPQRPFWSLFNVRVPAALHRAATLRAISDDVGLNDVVVRALDAFPNSRSEQNGHLKVVLERPPRLLKNEDPARQHTRSVPG